MSAATLEVKRLDLTMTILATVLGFLISAAPDGMAQTEIVLHSFLGFGDGCMPFSEGLVLDWNGTVYGTTNSCGINYKGIVFKVTPTGRERVLHTFGGTPDGEYPYGALVWGRKGSFYGTTSVGGATGNGTVFEITPTGTETVLYSFKGAPDGTGPRAGLLQFPDGTLYGTTEYGGAFGAGTVFQITPAGDEKVLYSFTGGADGSVPLGPLVGDAAGNLYGTTSTGGDFRYGTVFQITPAGEEKVLYSFTGGTDGSNPMAGLVRDAAGNLYGTTPYGGSSAEGTVFKITPDGRAQVLYSFTGWADGGRPLAGLTRDVEGNLYGTTVSGGISDNGIVFKVTRTGTESLMYAFAGFPGASKPSSLILDAAGNFYGLTYSGGAFNRGTVFRLTP